MASLIQWTWVWANSGRWWRTGKPGLLPSMGSWRVGHNWANEQRQGHRGVLRAAQRKPSVFWASSIKFPGGGLSPRWLLRRKHPHLCPERELPCDKNQDAKGSWYNRKRTGFGAVYSSKISWAPTICQALPRGCSSKHWFIGRRWKERILISSF